VRIGLSLKRTGLWLVLGLAVMLIVVNFALPQRNSKWVEFEKIEPGMTKAEVESLMGETEIYFPTISLGGPHSLGWTIDATLFSDEYCLQATFDYKWNVTKTRCYPVEPSYYRRFVRSFGW
jgi:hypothetical protein